MPDITATAKGSLMLSSAILPPAPRLLHRYRWREVCNALELFRICGTARCRRTQHCRGDPVACLRSGVQHAPEVAEFSCAMLHGQDEGLNFEDAFEEALDKHPEAYDAWISGLSAGCSR
jgi:hypothetical protein